MKTDKSTIFLKWFVLLLAVIINKPIIAQKVKLFYEIQKDKKWISIQKQKINSFRNDRSDKNYQIKLTQYFSNCYILGNYYENLFDRKKVSNLKKAISYYQQITDYGKFPDERKYEPNSAFKANLCRKLENIYFIGRGVKKDRDAALRYAKSGTTNTLLSNYYSYKYFNTKRIALGFEIINDSAYVIKLNPFAGILSYKRIKFIDKNLQIIGKNFKKSKDTTLQIHIQTYSSTSMASQANAINFMVNVKEYLVKKVEINENKIFIENIVDGGPLENCEIIFTRGYETLKY